MKIRKDFVTNSSSSNFILQTIYSVAPTAGVILGSLSSNMVSIAQSTSKSGANVSVSGSSAGDTLILDGKKAIQWLIANGFWNEDKNTFTKAFWKWYDSFYSEQSDSPLLGVCGDYNSDDRDNIELNNIAIAVRNPKPSSVGSQTTTKGDDASDDSDSTVDQSKTDDQSETEKQDEDVSDETEDKPDSPTEDTTSDTGEQSTDKQDESDGKKDETTTDSSLSSLVDKMNDKMDQFLTEEDRKILEGQNVTVKLEIEGKNEQTVQISVVDGVPEITAGSSKTANITIKFNEALIKNLEKLKASDDSNGNTPSVSDILNIEVKSDKTCNDLAMKLLINKVDEFVKDKQIDMMTAKAIVAAFKMHLTSEVFGEFTGMVGSMLEKYQGGK